MISISLEAIFAFVFACIFLLLSGLLSGAEVAFFSLSSSDKDKIDEEQMSSDSTLKYLHDKSDYLLASILLSGLFFCVLTVILGTYSFQEIFILEGSPYMIFCIEIAFWLLLLLLFGWLIPRKFFKKDALKRSRQVAPFLKLLQFLCRFPSDLLIKTTNAINQLFRVKSSDLSVEDLSKVLQASSEEISEEKEMLEGIISLYNKTAVEIMTSRLDIADIDIKSSFKQVIDYAINIGYSRIPVYAKNQDNIKGILYLKDLLPYIDKPDTFRWQSLIRPAFFVPETKKIDDLLEEFRTNKIHLAVVVDEFGGTSGIVTMEDILEEIVGEINDEYDDDELKYEELSDGSFLFEAKISLSDFFKVTGVDSKEFEKQTEEVDTLAGLILELKGDFPESNEIISFNSYRFEVSEISERRIQKVKFYREKESE